MLQTPLAANGMPLYKRRVPLSTKGPNSARHLYALAKCQGCPAAGGPSTDEPETEVPWPPQPMNIGVYLMFISFSTRHALHCSPAPTLCYKQDRGLLMPLTFLSGTAALRWQLSVCPPHSQRRSCKSHLFPLSRQAFSQFRLPTPAG